MKKPFVLGINGSPHKNGETAKILKLVLDGAKKEGAEIKIINLYDLKIIPEPGYYSENPKKAVPKKMPKDDVIKIYPEILRADGLVFATPTYWANMSGEMKLFIEHLTPLENDGFKLEGKVGAFIAASKENEGGIEIAAMSMVMALTQMGVLIPPNSILWHPGDWTTSKNKQKNWAKSGASDVGKNMVKLINLLKKNPIEWS